MPHRVPTGKALIPVFKEEPKKDKTSEVIEIYLGDTIKRLREESRKESLNHPQQGWLGSDCKWFDKGCTHFPLHDGTLEGRPSYCTYYKGNPCRSYFPKDLKCPECGKSTHIHKTGDHDYFCGWCLTIIKSNAHEVDKYFEEISKEEVVK